MKYLYRSIFFVLVPFYCLEIMVSVFLTGKNFDTPISWAIEYIGNKCD